MVGCRKVKTVWWGGEMMMASAVWMKAALRGAGLRAAVAEVGGGIVAPVVRGGVGDAPGIFCALVGYNMGDVRRPSGGCVVELVVGAIAEPNDVVTDGDLPPSGGGVVKDEA